MNSMNSDVKIIGLDKYAHGFTGCIETSRRCGFFTLSAENTIYCSFTGRLISKTGITLSMCCANLSAQDLLNAQWWLSLAL